MCQTRAIGYEDMEQRLQISYSKISQHAVLSLDLAMLIGSLSNIESSAFRS